MTIVKRKTSSAGRQPPAPIVPVSELPSVIAALFYGRSGTGKTTLASTFPKPLLLLDVREKGTDSIVNVSDCHTAQVDVWEDFENFYWYLKDGERRFKTVVIDQVTQLQDIALKKALADDNKQATDQISKRAFGQASGLLKNWLLHYRDLIDEGINVVFIAHDRTRDGDEGDDDQIDPSVGPMLMPSVGSFLTGAVKIIGNTFIRETTELDNKRRTRKISYALRVGPHSYYITKMRSPVGVAVPRVLVDPTYEKLTAIMRGKYSETAVSTKKAR